MIFENILNYFIEHPLVVVALGCFVYGIYLLLSRKPGGNSPVSIRNVRAPPKQLENDNKARDKVLKQRFKADRIPENLDTIVIGSGIGGLSTAVLLGRAGQKVLVLEQHDQAGGCCHTFVDKGYEFDTGIHYVGKMKPGESARTLIDQVTEGQVTWVPMDTEFDVAAIGPANNTKRYSIKSGSKEIYANNLKEMFPSEEQTVDKFMKILTEAKSVGDIGTLVPKFYSMFLVKLLIKTGLFKVLFSKYCKLIHTSVREALDQLTDNEEFKAVVCYIFGDMGVPPSKLGIIEFAQVVNHYIPGAYYPLGGTSEIAYQIVPIIERYGGKVLVDAPVTKILVDENGRANGVTVKRSSGEVNVHAKRVISEAGVINTFKYLLPKEIAQRNPLHHLVDKVGPSLSNIAVFVGMKGSSEELGLKACNTWYYKSKYLENDLHAYTSLPVEEAAEAECPMMFVSFPSAKDPNWEQKYPGKSVALLITFTTRSWFTDWKDERVKHRGKDYEELKMKFGMKMWRQTEQLFPKLAGKVSVYRTTGPLVFLQMDYIDVGTSLSNMHYLGQPEGETYGLDHGKTYRYHPETSMYLRPESGVPGLYLTGQDIISAGFSGALGAGVLTASAILGRNLFNDLTTIAKEQQQSANKKKI